MPKLPKLRLRGDAELLAKLKTLKQLRGLRGALLAAGAHVAGKLKEYPAARHGPQPFKTEKQRRYVFWAMARGIIQIPYRRGQSPGSRNLKQQWSVMAVSDTRVVVGNPTPYGPLVQSEEAQTRYHRATGWPTDQKVIESETDTAVQYVREALVKLVADE